jgi:hypothetical protein
LLALILAALLALPLWLIGGLDLIRRRPPPLYAFAL